MKKPRRVTIKKQILAAKTSTERLRIAYGGKPYGTIEDLLDVALTSHAPNKALLYQKFGEVFLSAFLAADPRRLQSLLKRLRARLNEHKNNPGLTHYLLGDQKLRGAIETMFLVKNVAPRTQKEVLSQLTKWLVPYSSEREVWRTMAELGKKLNG